MSALHLKGDVFVKVKKILSFILVAAMMLSIFVLPATAVSENEIVVVLRYNYGHEKLNDL